MSAADDGRRGVLMDWHAGDTFGWGLLGLNLLLQWAHDPQVRPLMGHPITRAALGPCDPLRLRHAYDAIERSNRFVAGLAAQAPTADGRRAVDAVVVDALGNDFAPSSYSGSLDIGRCIFEDTRLVGARDALAKYDALLVASRWNAELLEAATGRAATVIHEGVDPSLFCPGPPSGLLNPDRFHVFSGGKVEFRKGQDLTLLAFRAFARHRPDCVLVTAWQSIWPQRSVGFRGRLAAPVEADPHGMLHIGQWAYRNGIDPRKVVDLGLVPNALMPSVLREMHVALQPSRAEACTSLPVKEAMACGVPVIAAANTGMLDLLDPSRAIVLERQRPVDGVDADATDGWGESDVDEIVAALEFAYDHRDEARLRGLRAREWLVAEGRTWQAHAHALKTWILGLSR